MKYVKCDEHFRNICNCGVWFWIGEVGFNSSVIKFCTSGGYQFTEQTCFSVPVSQFMKYVLFRFSKVTKEMLLT